jgi:hypothetical protein
LLGTSQSQCSSCSTVVADGSTRNDLISTRAQSQKGSELGSADLEGFNTAQTAPTSSFEIRKYPHALLIRGAVQVRLTNQTTPTHHWLTTSACFPQTQILMLEMVSLVQPTRGRIMQCHLKHADDDWTTPYILMKDTSYSIAYANFIAQN